MPEGALTSFTVYVTLSVKLHLRDGRTDGRTGWCQRDAVCPSVS